MTDRALWVAAKQDYTNALAIANEAWNDIPGATAEAIQAAAATVLIHITKLRSEERIHVRIPHVAAPQPAEAKTAAQSGAVPPIPAACPKCNGKVWDNRENKKNPKAPDWKCRDKACVDEKGFTTGGWVEKPKGGNRFAGAGTKAPAGSYDELPEQLNDEADDLPF